MATIPTELRDLAVGAAFDLDAVGSWPRSRHVFDELSKDALQMAVASERPLLVRGEPGTGKSQLARAAAQKMGRAFISEVVHARTEPQDLQWRFDAVGRLGEAQAQAMRGGNAMQSLRQRRRAGDDALAPRRFLSPGPLWWAFDWCGAESCHAASRHRGARPVAPPGWCPQQGAVLLIDEIDKADADVPNSLLETLGNGSFPVPWGDIVVGQAGATPPLVVVTTNEERELPAAFLRRCVVLQYDLPKDLASWLAGRGQIHFPQCDQKVLGAAAERLVVARREARQAGFARPGQAEYLDLVRALCELGADAEEQIKLLARLSPFVYRKFRVADEEV
ncbi:MAG: AAA family ATPase [Rhodocyclaceae bacterium]|nr:AAA family ATPase [Rhodocyclaceae bacterium]